MDSQTKSPDLLGKFVQELVRNMTSELESNAFLKDLQARWNEALADIGNCFPAADVDIVQNDGSLTVKADLAGFDKKDIELDIDGNVLLISAERKKPEEAGRVHMNGRPSAVKKKVILPFAFVEEQPAATAEYKDGVLTVHIKKPKSKKSIAIT